MTVRSKLISAYTGRSIILENAVLMIKWYKHIFSGSEDIYCDDIYIYIYRRHIYIYHDDIYINTVAHIVTSGYGILIVHFPIWGEAYFLTPLMMSGVDRFLTIKKNYSQLSFFKISFLHPIYIHYSIFMLINWEGKPTQKCVQQRM